jgi:hypothetical protein
MRSHPRHAPGGGAWWGRSAGRAAGAPAFAFARFALTAIASNSARSAEFAKLGDEFVKIAFVHLHQLSKGKVKAWGVAVPIPSVAGLVL